MAPGFGDQPPAVLPARVLPFQRPAASNSGVFSVAMLPFTNKY